MVDTELEFLMRKPIHQVRPVKGIEGVIIDGGTVYLDCGTVFIGIDDVVL